MYWLTVPLLLVLASCASLDPKASMYDVTYVPPALGPQMDMDSMKSSQLDRLR